LEARPRLADEAAEIVVEVHFFRAFENHADLEMVLQVAADARHVVHERDAMLGEQRGRADAGELEQLRRVERAAERMTSLDARAVRTAPFCRYSTPIARRPSRARAWRARWSRRRGSRVCAPAEIAARRAPTPPVMHRRLVVAGAFLARAVEIVVALQPGLLGRGDEGIAQLVRRALVGNLERAADAVQIVGPVRLILGALEIGQKVVPAPAGIASWRQWS